MIDILKNEIKIKNRRGCKYRCHIISGSYGFLFSLEKTMKKHENLFITIEGGEGSGKTTQSFLLKKYLEDSGYEVLLTREPGGTVLAENIRDILLSPNLNLIALSELFLLEAARAQHIKNLILPALKKGKIVICDRFIDSTVAYQGYGRKLDLQLINSLNLVASFGLIPILTIYIDVIPSKGLEIAKKNNSKVYNACGDRIESESMQFHNDVRKGYIEQARKYPKRIKVIKSQVTLDRTHALIKNIVGAVL
ncbi:MAG: dTMP kinase [Endomicrobium sp.]|jgi:dTMP kinase|nr:dTMP kinase [Endomicrobium sp.]